MRIGIVGSGRIGGGAARMLARSGHEVMVSYSRDPEALRALAEEIGGHIGTPSGAVEFGEVVVFAVPWAGTDEALAATGPLDGKIIIDTTNQFGADGVLDLGGDDPDAKAVVSGLIEDAGFVAVDIGGTADAAPVEPPRRDGALYGEEYREPDARAAADALRAGRPIPPPPRY